MSHEKSITIGVGGKFFNIPSVVKGKQLSKRAAFEHAKKNKTFGKGFPTIKTAVAAAVKRSKSFDRPRNPSGQVKRKKR